MLAWIPGIPIWIGILLVVVGGVACLLARKWSSRVFAFAALGVGVFAFFHPPLPEPQLPPATGSDADVVAKFAENLKHSTDPEERKAANALQDFLASAPEPQGPLWSADNLGWHTNKTVEYRHIIASHPPFYSGSSATLEFTEGASPGGVLFYYDFGAFRNQFKLNDAFTIMGARTVDENGHLLAEARIRYYVNGNTQGRELEEFHYDPAGKVIFKCKSQIDPNSGFKIGESSTNGRKIRDYYFMWPLQTSAVR